MKHPIPRAALDDRLGFLGTSGSGKTYNAGTAVELLLASKARVVILDPLGVWWGLRLLADGKKPSGWNVAIFGGSHGDLPLTEHAGALIGETAATMAESCIIDLSELKTKTAERRFMVAFLETIFRKANGEPFHLIVDEADLFAPQKPQAGDEVLLGHMENIVRRGRVKGFIPWLISQRPAVLNKNVLSQVDGLLAFKLTSTQDRDALDSWIEGQADKAEGKAIKDGLPTLQIGQGVVWIPGRGILECPAAFPTKVTFDSSRTPKRGEKVKHRTLKPVNIGRLKEQLASVVEEAKANDPKALRSEIATLKAERDKLAKAAPAKAKVDPDAIKAAEQRGFEQAKKSLRREAAKHAHDTIIDAMAALDALVGPIAIRLKEQLGAAQKNRARLDVEFTPSSASPAVIATPTRPAIAKPLTRSPAAKPPSETGGDVHLSGPQRQLLQSLAWWKAMGHDRPTRVQVASICGWRITSGHLKNISGSLRSLGMIDYPTDGTMALTREGEASAPEPDTSTSLEESVRGILTGPQRQAFDVLPPDGSELTREQLAECCGWNITSGHVKNVLGSMRSLEVIDYPGQGMVARSEWLRRAA